MIVTIVSFVAVLTFNATAEAKAIKAVDLAKQLAKAKVCRHASTAGATAGSKALSSGYCDVNGLGIRIETYANHATMLLVVQAHEAQECATFAENGLAQGLRRVPSVVGTTWWATTASLKNGLYRRIAKVLHARVQNYKCPPPQPQTGTGHGDAVIDVTFPPDLAIVHITYNGGGNFAVWSYGANGQQQDLLVNTIGGYAGTRLLNLRDGDPTKRLQIQADGDWSYEIKPVASAPIASAPGHFDGNGDSIVIVSGSAGTAHFHATGDSNFAVWGYARSGQSDLLVNEIGAYDGTVIIASDLVLVDVQAVGPWSVDFAP